MREVELQETVENLATEIGAAIGLNEVDETHIAHSSHEDFLMDDVRRHGVMNRRLTPDQVEWFLQWGYRNASQPVRTPADRKRGILARWCVPVMFRGRHLAYLWILDAGKLSKDDLTPATEAANHLGVLLYRRQIQRQLDNDVLRLMLMPNPEIRSAVTEARTFGAYTHAGPIAVILVGVSPTDDSDERSRSDVETAIERAVGQTSSPDVLAGRLGDVGAVLAPLHEPDDLTPAYDLAQRVRRGLQQAVGERSVAAIGGATDLEYASASYRQARRTLGLIGAMPHLGSVARWDDLGVLRVLALLPPDEAADAVIDPRVNRLLADDVLANTAGVFLDTAGSAAETAKRLYIHRTTLYQRLDRTRVLYNLDLRESGEDRLVTHLGLKVARFSSDGPKGRAHIP